ncbi:MAG TPA: SDR family NAD(P)-dependent oxidoreductase, partial [Gemmatimonadaceae bacterium]|nr:SDR family NAD(P)-dependent oxidoreductase [Gemmatimonadaceae bacterium]
MRRTTSFDTTSTADDVLHGVDLAGRRAIVTGGASGIGVETARALTRAGAEVTLAVRDTTTGERVAADIVRTTNNPHVRVSALDLSVRDSVSAFVNRWTGPLHILVNNAGVMASPLSRTVERWEMQFGTNHLGHFALTLGLKRALAAAGGARVVSVSSSAHLRAGVEFGDIHFERRAYDPWIAYGQSKTANVLFAVAATQKWSEHGIAVNALMPGAIRTALQRHVSEEELDRLRAATGSGAVVWKTTQQGAATSVLLAASPLVEGV